MADNADRSPEIAILVEIVLDLYAREVGLRTCLTNRGVVAVGDLSHYILEAQKQIGARPEIQNLKKAADPQTLAALLRAMKDS
jgi:hypothetical protein